MTEAKHTEFQAGEYLTQQEAWGRITELESRNTALVEALEELLSESYTLTFAHEQAERKARATLKQAKGES